MFGKSKTSEVAKPAMIQGSAAMMLRGMGVDPVEVERVAETLIAEISGAHARLAAIETRLDALETQGATTNAKLDAILVALNASDVEA